MNIAYVTVHDVTDSTLRGSHVVGYYMAQALRNQSMSLEYIGPLRVPKAYSLLFKAKARFYGRVLKKKYTFSRDRILLKNYARQVSRKLSGLNVDIVFSSLSYGSQPIAYLESDRPIVIWTDATLAGVINWYPRFRNLCKETVRDGIANERSALSKSGLAIYASEWAAQTAVENYQIDPSKVKVVPFGPLLDCDRNFDDVKTMVNSRPKNKCKLLFLGVNWVGKGGDTALSIAKELNKSDLETELTIVGCHPVINEPLPTFVRSLGYISKSTKEGLNKINRLLSESHFLILPSTVEAFGHVFCEASSFGVPCLATKVGGIPTVVRDGLNGKTFSKDASIEEYCTYISNLLSDYSRYKNLALSSFSEYQSRLNWSVAGHTVKKLLTEVLQSDVTTHG